MIVDSTAPRSRLTGKTPRRRAVRPSVDPLEDRTTPSTFVVTNGLDPVGRLVPGSLRWAITQANRSRSADPVVAITSSAGSTITLHAGELRVSNSLTLENVSGAPVTIEQATPNARILHVVANPRTATVTIEGGGAGSTLTLTGGHARNANGGAILVDNPNNSLSLQYVDVVGNSAAQAGNPNRGSGGNGGGIYARGTVTLDQSSVSDNSANGPNSATGHAGGVYTDQGITLVASHVDGNSARNGGGILNVFGSVEVVDGSTVNGNSSTGKSLPTGNFGGGGIGEMVGNVVVSDSQVNNNPTVGMFSGGIVILLGGVTVTDGSQIDGNTNNGPGGGIAANFGGAVVITNGSQVDGNTGAGIGGGIVNFSENFGIDVINGSQVSDNKLTNGLTSESTTGLADLVQQPPIGRALVAGGRGDAALAAALQLFVNACAQRLGLLEAAINALPASGNTQVGGGIAEMLGGPVDISGGSAVSDNHFGTTPGAHYPALGLGGGIFANLGTITVDASSVSQNNASGSGGGIWNGYALTITNSTVTGNQAGAPGGGIYDNGTIDSTSNDIADNTPDNIYPAL